jgi:hypothetical protein
MTAETRAFAAPAEEARASWVPMIAIALAQIII